MITWSDTYATGVARIDEEHQKLVGMLNDLEQAIQRGQGSQLIGAVIDGLARYADTHFAYEEGCMQRLHCPTASANQQAHAGFRTMIAKARARLTGGGNALAAQQVHRELCDWIVNHILRVDSALRRCRSASAQPA